MSSLRQRIYEHTGAAMVQITEALGEIEAYGQPESVRATRRALVAINDLILIVHEAAHYDGADARIVGP